MMGRFELCRKNISVSEDERRLVRWGYTAIFRH